jgi:hypothetical protein
MPARDTRPPEVSSATATEAVAKSPTRRSSFRYPPDRLDRDLVHGERVLERTGHELRGRDRALPARPGGDHVAAQRDDRRRPVTLRVGVAQRAHQGAAVADDRVGDERCRRGHRGLPVGEEVGVLEVDVPAQGADPDRAVGVDAVVGEPGQPVDVDEQVRVREAQLEHRHQALPAGEHLAVRAAGEQRERLVQ